MLEKTLRTIALPTLIASALALFAIAPATAYADDDTSQSQEQLNALVQQMNDAAQNTSAARQYAQWQDFNSGLSSSLLDECSNLASQANAAKLVDLALSLEGSPYAYGGTTPRGFDCSGFTRYCYKNALGIDLPRTAAGQASLGKSVSMDELQPGDLLFWGSGSGIYHVGIYLENDTYIHAAGSGKGVRVQTMDYYRPTSAKRLSI